MKLCLSFDDVLGAGQPQIAELLRLGSAHAGAQAPGAGVAFSRQARLVEGGVVQTYGVAAALARKAEDLAEVAGCPGSGIGV
jgi:hypothetical protein